MIELLNSLSKLDFEERILTCCHSKNFANILFLERPFESKEDLFEKIKAIWNHFPLENLQNLIKSMPRRIQSVIDANGAHIKY